MTIQTVFTGTANTLSISEFVDKIGIELEGGWNRFSGTSDCNHSCDGDCQEPNCEHGCQQTDDCWENECEHDCVTSIECSPNTLETSTTDDTVTLSSHCVHECENSYSISRRANPCFVRACVHECDADCYTICSHLCEDSDYGCQTRIDGFRHDGSVSISGCEITGEAASPPCSSWSDFESWVTKWAPDKVNRSCGTHIHVSTILPSDYDRLMGPAFYPYFKECMTVWGNEHLSADNEFWARLRGENDYCCANDAIECSHGTNSHDSETQNATIRKGSCRYAHVNFCRQLHGTVEFRLFHGMKTPSLIMSAAKALVSCIDTFLVQSRAEDNKVDAIDIDGLLGIVSNEAIKLAQTVGFYAKKKANLSWDMNFAAEGYQHYVQDNLNVDTPADGFKVSVKRFVKLCKDIDLIPELEDDISSSELNGLNEAKTILAKAVAAGNTHAIITGRSYRAIKRLEHRLKTVDIDETDMVRVYLDGPSIETRLGLLRFKSRFYNMMSIIQGRWSGLSNTDRDLQAFMELQNDLSDGIRYGYDSESRAKIATLNHIANQMDRMERRRRNFIRLTHEQMSVMLEAFQLTDLFLIEIQERLIASRQAEIEALKAKYPIGVVLSKEAVSDLKDKWQRIANNQNLDGRTIGRLRRRIEASINGFDEVNGHTIVNLPSSDHQAAVLEIYELAKKPKQRYAPDLSATDEFLLVTRADRPGYTAPTYSLSQRPDLYDTYVLAIQADETLGSTAYGINVMIRPSSGHSLSIMRSDTISMIVTHLDTVRRNNPLSNEAKQAWKQAIVLLQAVTNEPLSYIISMLKSYNPHLSFNIDAYMPPVERSTLNAADVSNPFIDISREGTVIRRRHGL